MTSNWYVLAVHSRKESYVETQLAAKKLNAVCPRYAKITAHARARRRVMAPIFPGYVFVELQDPRRSWREVNAIAGSIGLLRMDSRPVPLNCAFVSTFISNSTEEGGSGFKQFLNSGAPLLSVGRSFGQKFGEFIKMSDDERVLAFIGELNRGAKLSPHQIDLVAAA